MFYDKPYFISVPRFSFHQWQCSTHDKFQLTVGANSKLNSHVSTLQKHLRVMSICFPRSPGIVGARRDIVGITFAKPWYGTPFSKPRNKTPLTMNFHGWFIADLSWRRMDFLPGPRLEGVKVVDFLECFQGRHQCRPSGQVLTIVHF